ncbi:MAG: cbb3-type cytochrome oxidase assembly protein CcoS [Bacteroidota bacterium]|nr:cbb3-type cytochrome oxidase assembly protein CcoS [Bacteroidota bacterium]
MSAIFILIGVSIVVASGFLVAFIRAVRTGQFEDEYTPSVRMLFDDELTPRKQNTSPEKENPKEKTSTNV